MSVDGGYVHIQRILTVEPLIFGNVIKWTVWASAADVIGGLATRGFLVIRKGAVEQAGECAHVFLFLPGALFVASLLTTLLAPDANWNGTRETYVRQRSLMGPFLWRWPRRNTCRVCVREEQMFSGLGTDTIEACLESTHASLTYDTV